MRAKKPGLCRKKGRTNDISNTTTTPINTTMGGFFMNHESVTITYLTRAHVPAVIDLIMAQEMRQSRQNESHLATRSRHQIEVALTNQYNSDTRPVVALNRYGN